MNKPDFSGTWKFSASESRLQIAPPDTAVLVIDHREPVFRISRTHIFHGKSDTVALSLTTDGKETAGEGEGLRFRSRAFWEGETLIFESLVERGSDTGVNTVRYRLSNSRNALTAEERLRSTIMNYDNLWVMERQP